MKRSAVILVVFAVVLLVVQPVHPAWVDIPERPVMIYGSYLGGTERTGGWDMAYDLAVDSWGNAYVVGSTNSEDFPAERGAYSSCQGGGRDAFVAKFNSSGRGLEWATYLGGDGADAAFAVALDGQGCVYVTGETNSSNFPRTTPGLGSNEPRGGNDVFVVKLSPDGRSVERSITLGGDRDDSGQTIGVGPDGSVFVMGNTHPGSGFPVINPLVTSVSGAGCGFVALISAEWTSFRYCSLVSWATKSIGITMFRAGVCDVALDESGNAYVTGSVNENNLHTVNPSQAESGGYEDAFVAKIAAAGGYAYSTYFGGSNRDYGTSIALGDDGSLYITGMTQSPDLPARGQSEYQGYTGDGRPPQDCFVAKFDRDGVPVWSRYIGGSDDDLGFAIDTDPYGNPYVTGYTESLDFPVLNGESNSNGTSVEDCFVFRLGGDDGEIVFSTTFLNFGTSLVDASDRGYGLAVDASLSTYLCGWTGAKFENITTFLDQRNSAFPQMKGKFDAFIFKLSDRVPRITTVSKDYTSFRIEWSPPFPPSYPGPTGYIVRYGENRSTSESTGTLPPEATATQVLGLDPEKSYYFRVTALYPGGVQATSLDRLSFSVGQALNMSILALIMLGVAQAHRRQTANPWHCRGFPFVGGCYALNLVLETSRYSLLRTIRDHRTTAATRKTPVVASHCTK